LLWSLVACELGFAGTPRRRVLMVGRLGERSRKARGRGAVVGADEESHDGEYSVMM
jgi:hypothetical protein